ncbi:MAG TPA: outer membrane lipoprotein-sorting protein [Bacteroidetes bacterium]|nr:outer membrane lipoprotein-sorting protein [Bacteroidota bacterium]
MKLFFKAFLVIILVLTHSFEVFAQDATEIIRRSDAHLRGESSTATLSMTIVRPSWSRTMELKSWSRGAEFSLILVTSPARDKGTTFLKRQNEIWNWVPSIGRSVKLPPSMMMQSWMGSDFTNDDLVRESSVVEDYVHELIEITTLDGHDVYVIDMIPKPDAAVVWGRVRVYITTQDYLQLKSEFFDEYEELVNVMIGEEIKVFDGRRLPSKMRMIPADEPGNETIIEYKDLSFSVQLSESFFTVQNMRRVE